MKTIRLNFIPICVIIGCTAVGGLLGAPLKGLCVGVAIVAFATVGSAIINT